MSVLAEIEEICAGFPGRVGLSATHLQTNETINHNATDYFPTASVIKLPILTTLMHQIEQGDYTLDDPLMLRRADHITGSGLLQYLTPGLTMPLRDWAFLMMNISDNVATNVLIDHVGLSAITDWLEINDYTDMELRGRLDFATVKEDQHNFGTATPASLTRLMAAIFRHEIVTPAACEEMIRMMKGVGRPRMGRYLPFEAWSGDPLPPHQLQLAGKTGSFVGTRVQTGLVWREREEGKQGFAITVMTEGATEPETWRVDHSGVLLIGRLTRLVYDTF